MKTITFECETITPMFCYGADQKTPEIRAASIKGAMRFWWRALHPEYIEVKDEKEDFTRLREEETKIFGGSGFSYEDKGKIVEVPARRSQVIVQISEPLIYDGEFEYSPVPHKKNGKAFPQPAFKSDQKFIVELKLTKPKIIFKDHQDKEHAFDVETLKSLFILFSILGGIGKRSRRGFGSFRINSYKIDNGKEQYVDYNNIMKTINDSLKILKDIKKDEKDETINIQIEENKIDIQYNEKKNRNYPYLKNIQLGNQSGNSADDLLRKIGEASHDNCNNSLGFAKDKQRLSSPVYVSVIKNEKHFNPVITTLNTVFEKKNWTINTEKQASFINTILDIKEGGR